jgi:CubicO group peptidase (beta-lactamase class C family)
MHVLPVVLASAVALANATTAPVRAAAPPPATLAVDSLMRAEMSRRLIPAAAVVVLKDGGIVQESVYGLASVELGVPATARTLFQVASATKNVTGVAVMRLVEAGKFGLDDRVTSLLPGLPPAWEPVTVRQLLSHTSGLPDVIVDPEKGLWLPGSRDSMLKQLAARPVKPAGAEWEYNQTNYLLLGMLVEKFTGLAFTEYCRRELFEPLGMSSVVFGDTRLVVSERATEYTRLGVARGSTRLTDLRALAYEYPEALLTAAGMFLNADDMAKWLVGVSKGATLRPASFAALTTTVEVAGKPFHFPESTMGYGLGWIVLDDDAHPGFGGSGGGRCAVFHYPGERLAVAVMTNLQGAGPEDLVERVAAVYRRPR